MRFEDQLNRQEYAQIWQEYCGFLDLSLEEYMFIQKRLMQEQVDIWSQCALGRQFLGGRISMNFGE